MDHRKIDHSNDAADRARRGRLGRGLAIAAGAAAMATAALTPAASQADPAPARCDAVCLRSLMDSFLGHMVKDDPKGLPIATDAVIRENAAPVVLGEGAWKLVNAVKAKQVFVDATTGQAWSYDAVELKGAPLAQMSVRLKVVGRKVTEVETIVNTGPKANGGPYPGGPYNAENILEQDILYMAPVPPERRVTREQLIKIADSYFQAIGTHDANAAPFGSRCERYESGLRGTNQLRRNADQAATQGAWSGTCGSSLTNLTGQQTVERRYPVVDVDLGVVVGYMFIQHHERNPPQDNYINEMFKVVDGKIWQMDAVGFNLSPVTLGFASR